MTTTRPARLPRPGSLAPALLACAALIIPTSVAGQSPGPGSPERPTAAESGTEPGSASGPEPGSGPRFEPGDCPFEAGPEVLEQVRCGWVMVPQDRARPDGKQLRLAVAILESPSPAPRADPIVFLSGGPGDPSVEYMPGRIRSPFWNHVRAERDVVFFDQRGTGYSEPEFCREVTEEAYRMTFEGLSAEERSERLAPVLTRCGERMRERGVDLSQYNSVASALDLHDLRRALGYEEWNLLGGSYGTRLALEAMRTAPAGIRSVVLDGPAPPNAFIDADQPVNFADVLGRIAAACAADTGCSDAYPDLEDRVWRTVEELNEDPWIVRGGSRVGLPDPIVVDGYLFAVGLFQGLYMRPFIQVAPLFVEEVRRRNEAMLLAVAGPLSSGLRASSRAQMLAVQCFESIPFNGPERRDALRGRYPEILDRVGFGTQGGDAAMCAAWHEFRAGPPQVEPVRSEIPTLVFTGEFDPITHRRYGPVAAAGLTSAHVVEVPAMGHGASLHHDCTRTMLVAFLDDPGIPPDRGCIRAEMEPLRFVTDVRVTPGISRLAAVMASGGVPGAAAGFGVPLIVLVGSAVGWPVAAGVRRLRRRERPSRTMLERRARWGVAAFALLALGYAIALVRAILRTGTENPMVLAFGLPAREAPLLAAPWVLLAGSLALAATAALAWRRNGWTRAGRLHFVLIAAAGLVLAATLVAGGLV